MANPRWPIRQGTRGRAGAALEQSPGHWRVRNAGRGAGSTLLPTLQRRLHGKHAYDTHLDTQACLLSVQYARINHKTSSVVLYRAGMNQVRTEARLLLIHFVYRFDFGTM